MSGLAVEIGEIKPIAWATTYGVEDAEHYVLRARQSMDRQFGRGVECPSAVAGTDDALFARTVQAGRLVPRAFGMMTGVLPNDTVIGPFDGDRERTLKAKQMAPGAIGYWCTGGASDTFTCGASQEQTRAYIDRAMTPAQEVLSRVLEDQVERPLARRLQQLSIRELLEMGDRHMGPQIRELLRQHVGLLGDVVLNQVNARDLADFIDQNLGPAAKSIATTLARRFVSRMMNELRIRLRDALADVVRDTLARLCVGVPAVTLATLMGALEEEVRRRTRQLLPVVATAVAFAMVAEVAAAIQEALAGLANGLLKILGFIALALLAVAIVVVGIIFIGSVIDMVPGDEVLVAALEGFLVRLFSSLGQFVFAMAESGAPDAVLAENASGESTAAGTGEGSPV